MHERECNVGQVVRFNTPSNVLLRNSVSPSSALESHFRMRLTLVLVALLLFLLLLLLLMWWLALLLAAATATAFHQPLEPASVHLDT